MNFTKQETAVLLRKAQHVCDWCGEKFSGPGCDKCCDHEFDPSEGFTCLNCGKDGAEEVLSAAYDRAKDLRRYGH